MTNIGRASLFVLSGAALVTSVAAGCSSPDSSARAPNTTPVSGASSGGSSSAGTTTNSTSGSSSGGNTAGGNATAGSSGSSGGPPDCTILLVQNATITEFTPPDAGPAGAGGEGAGGEGGAAPTAALPIPSISFGYDADPPTVASGYSFFYPTGTLTSDISSGAWHISGSVADYAGFQIAFLCGADAKAFKGISFKISGNAGPSGALSFVVAHASDTWRDPNGFEPTAASCVSVNQYDGTCTEAAAPVTVAETETTISLMWADIKGGKPEMNPDPSEILALRWLFKWDPASAADAAAHQYDVDVTIDDLAFIE